MKREKLEMRFHSSMEREKSEFTILMFPWLAYSHVHPFLELAKNLSRRRFHIYFCSSAINLDSIRDKIESGLSIDLIELSLPSLSELPPHLHTTKNLPSNLFPTLVQAFQQSSSNFSQILNRLSPDLLIYDYFQPWAAKQAMSRNIPCVYFATAGSAPFSYFHHIFTHGASLPFPHEEIYLHDHEKSAPLLELVVQDADLDSFSFGVFKLSCEVVLIKGSGGFDGKYMDYLSHLCNKKIIPTGPLIGASERNSNTLQWLNMKGKNSTLFICFGSEHFISIDQILEIAKGLELCDVNFLWVVRFCKEDERERLGRGFLERVRERGLIVEGWVGQGEILLHPSIGGFVSHCGWSSVMESLCAAVPVIAMPIKYDQPVNARVVVEAGAGVEVVRGGEGLFEGEAVAEAVRRVMVEESGEGIRKRAEELSERMKEIEGGEVDEAAEELLLLCKKGKEEKLIAASQRKL